MSPAPMITKLLGILLAFMILLAGPAAAQPVIRLSPPDPSVTSGDSFSVDIRLDVPGGTAGPVLMGVFLDYDPARLQFDGGLTNHSIFNNALFTTDPSDDAEPGIISFSASSTATAQGDNLLVATLNFTAVASGATSLAFSTEAPRDTILLGIDSQPITTTIEDAAVSVAVRPTAQLRLTPTSQLVGSSEDIFVDVLLDPNGLPVRRVRNAVRFDPAVLQFNEGTVNNGVFDSTLLRKSFVETSPGTVTFAAGSLDDLPSGDQTVATLRFTSLTDGQARLELIPEAPEVSVAQDILGSPLGTQLTGSMVSIAGTPMASLALSADRQSVPAGEAVHLRVLLDSHSVSPAIVEGYLEYDPARMSFEGGTINTQVFDNQLLNRTPQASEGVVAFTAAAGEAVNGDGVAVADLVFRSLAPGESSFEFLSTPPRATQAFDTDVIAIATAASGAAVTTTATDPATVRFVMANQSLDFNTALSVDVVVNPGPHAARDLRGVISFDDDLLNFTGGTINTTVFDNPAGNTIPAQTPGQNTITFNASSLSELDGEVVAATLSFQTGSVLGTADFDFLVRTPGDTALISPKLNALPLQSPCAAAFVVGAVPLVASIGPANPPPTNAALASFNVTFTENVSGFSVTDLSLESNGLTGVSIASVTGGPSTYSVSVNTGTGEGTLRLMVIDNDSVSDGDTLPLGGEGFGNGSFAGPYLAVDRSAPTPTFASSASNPTNATSFPLQVLFDEPVNGFTVGDIQVTGGATVTGFMAQSTVLYTLNVNTPNAGTITINIPAAAATDNIGNPSVAASTLAIDVDRTAPVLSSASAGPCPTNAPSITFVLSAAEPIKDVAPGTFGAALAGSLSGTMTINPVRFDSSTYHVTVAGLSGEGSVELTIAPGKQVLDLAGNAVDLIATSTSCGLDTIAPEMDAIMRVDASPTEAETISFLASFSEPVVDVSTTGFILVTNGLVETHVDSVEPGPDAHTWLVNVLSGRGQGTLRVDYTNPGDIQDPAGNALSSPSTGQTFASGETYQVNRADFGPTGLRTSDIIGFLLGTVVVDGDDADVNSDNLADTADIRRNVDGLPAN